VNRIIILLLSLFFINNCSFNDSSRLWEDKEKNRENKKTVSELNQKSILDLSKIIDNNKTAHNRNDYGSKEFSGSISKIDSYKYKKFKDVDQLSYKPIFLENGLIFFDQKGSIIRYDDKQKILWKKNFYSKSEKKLSPKLNFLLDGENLIVTDSIAKYYSLNINTAKLNWSKKNTYPFNSEIKKDKNKIFAVDYNNTLRCFDIIDGSECWRLQTEDSFTLSSSKFSLIIIEDKVIFNNSIGDITAANIESGLIVWQLPTQSNDILKEVYNFKISKLVSEEESIYFSNNKNEFYSVNAKTGITNWTNEINSNLMPIILSNFIFSVSNEGYLYVIDKKKGNIIKIIDLYKNYKDKQRKTVNPVGFKISKTNLYLTNSDGKMMVVNLEAGKVVDTVKISRNYISEPFIFNKNLYIIKNGSIVAYN